MSRGKAKGAGKAGIGAGDAKAKARALEEAKPLTKKRKAELMRDAERVYWTSLPHVVRGMVQAAEQGRLTGLKLLLDLGGLGPGVMANGRQGKSKAKGLDALLLAEIRRSREEAAANEVRRRETMARNLKQLEDEEQQAATVPKANGGGAHGV